MLKPLPIEDGFVAIINSRPDGRWDIDLWERTPRGDHKFSPEYVTRIYGVCACATVRTEAAAQRKASKMLTAVRKASAAYDRGRYEVRK